MYKSLLSSPFTIQQETSIAIIQIINYNVNSQVGIQQLQVNTQDYFTTNSTCTLFLEVIFDIKFTISLMVHIEITIHISLIEKHKDLKYYYQKSIIQRSQISLSKLKYTRIPYIIILNRTIQGFKISLSLIGPYKDPKYNYHHPDHARVPIELSK